MHYRNGREAKNGDRIVYLDPTADSQEPASFTVRKAPAAIATDILRKPFPVIRSRI